MRKIVPPTCDSCKATAQFESEWGVQFCYQCLRDAASFMALHGLLESNPLCELLFDGVWRTTDSTYEVWHRSLNYYHGEVHSAVGFMDGSSSSNLWITRTNPDLYVIFA